MRAREREALEELIAQVRAGRSATLLLRGEAGIGKTWLLDYVAQVAEAAEVTVTRSAGFETQQDLAYAGIHQLLQPFLEGIAGLPRPQRDALNSAFGRVEGVSPDKFLVGLGVLTLLADVGERTPVLCVIDDLHWLDAESRQVLIFVSLRLKAEHIGMVFSWREESEGAVDIDGLPALHLSRLNEEEAGELLLSRCSGRLDPDAKSRILLEGEGNPLALVELATGLTAEQRVGRGQLPDQLPLSRRIEQRFHERVRRLPQKTQRLLLIASADAGLDAATFWRAAQSFGLDVADATPAQADGLLTVETKVRFRHPLVGSAVYSSASLCDRQSVHRAIAEAQDEKLCPERRAWHRARAATGPDEGLAAELEQCAARTRQRGGKFGAAAFLERAAEFTPAPERKTGRLLAAAMAHFEAGNLERASHVVDQMPPLLADPLQRAMTLRLRGSIAFRTARYLEANLMLVQAAQELEALDAHLSRETHLDALCCAAVVGCFGKVTVETAARAARGAPSPERPRTADLVLDAIAVLRAEGHAAAAPMLRKALTAVRSEDPLPMGWLSPAFALILAVECWDDEALGQIAARAVQAARDSGSLGQLPVALMQMGMYCDLPAGRFDSAEAAFDEAREIAGATGNKWVMRSEDLLPLAWRGREPETTALADAVIQAAQACGAEVSVLHARYALAVLYNGLGKHERAMAEAERLVQPGQWTSNYFSAALPELVEAAVRCGNMDVALRAAEQLEERALQFGTPWALGVLAQSRALVATGADAVTLFRESVAHLERTSALTVLARTYLLYGEWLRHNSRRRDAREELRRAYKMFAQFGARGFEERARTQLVAVGERTGDVQTVAAEQLTGQEARAAQFAAQGLTNAEIAAKLFVSPHTVKYYLAKVFAKLGISTRVQLSEALRRTRN